MGSQPDPLAEPFVAVVSAGGPGFHHRNLTPRPSTSGLNRPARAVVIGVFLIEVM